MSTATRSIIVPAAVALLTPAIAQYGSLDPTFGSGGIATFDAAQNSDLGLGVLQQPDGKVVIAGYGVVAGVTIDVVLARALADGSPDPSFGTNGEVQHDFGGNEYGRGVLIQPDGKLVVCGTRGPAMMLVRFLPNGAPDAAFGTGGLALASHPGGGLCEGYAAALQPDGKVVVCGYATVSSVRHLAATRVNADGTTDTGFGTDGWAVVPLGVSTSEARAIVRQPDGRMLLTGKAWQPGSEIMAAVRLMPDGALDPGFNGTGTVLLPMAIACEGAALQPDGKALLGGFAYAEPGSPTNFEMDACVVRVNADGTLDTGFGTSGMAKRSLGDGNDFGGPVAVQADGRILLTAVASGPPHSDYGVACFEPDGSTCVAFGNDGTLRIDLGGGNDYGRCMALQADGQILVGGYGLIPGAGDVMAIARLQGPFAGIGEGGGPARRAMVVPNPATEGITLLVGGSLGPTGSVAVFDGTGRVVLEERAPVAQGGLPARITVDVSGLVPGRYTAVVRDDAGPIHAPFVKH